MNTGCLVYIRPWGEVLYVHSLKCVLLIEGVFKMSSILIFLKFLSLHSLCSDLCFPWNCQSKYIHAIYKKGDKTCCSIYLHITSANCIQNFIQHSAVNVNSVSRGNYWGSSMWISTQQINYWSCILHSSNTSEMMGIKWGRTSAFIDLRKLMIQWIIKFLGHKKLLTHCGRVTQICVFNTVKLGTSASSS